MLVTYLALAENQHIIEKSKVNNKSSVDCTCAICHFYVSLLDKVTSLRLLVYDFCVQVYAVFLSLCDLFIVYVVFLCAVICVGKV